MRKALIIGIDYYEHIGSLSGLRQRRLRDRGVLERHADGTVNFAPQVLVGISV